VQENFFSIRVTAAAERDLLTGFEFYELQNPGLGDYFLDSVFADIDSLCIAAGAHPLSFANFYRMLAKRFPFAIYYELEQDTVFVVAVLDCRQNPASIKNRFAP
jgi:plasmid stabilization system protein ParE